MPDDPYADPVTGVLRNKLGLTTPAELAAAEREITHAALILLRDTPARPAYDLAHLCEVHRRIFGEQLADDAGFTLVWQHLDADRHIAASAAIMRGDAVPMRKMLDELVRER